LAFPLSALAASVLLAAAPLGADPLAVRPSSPGGTSSEPLIPTETAQLAALDAARAAAQEPATHGGAAPGAVVVAPTGEPLAIVRQDSTGSSDSAYSSSDATVVGNVPFTQLVDCGAGLCQVRLDVYIPAGPGPFPTVVLARGGPSGMGGRSNLDRFAKALASRGLLVFNADYRDVAEEGGGYPNAFQDLSCAVRFARSQASRYHGDAGPVTLVGHSLGGWVGSVVALDADEFTGGCLAGGSGRPDAFVGLAGNYRLDADEVSSDLNQFFGGSASETAAARNASNPFSYATRSPIPVRLVAGGWDVTVYPSASISLNAFLLKRNWNVQLTLVPGATHSSILKAGETGFPSVAAVLSAISAARCTADAIDPVKGRAGQ
jgi:acetyl esterase/lipase